MIKVELHGRLGNQLFQYATARALQEKTGQDILISLRTIKGEKDKEGGSGWEDTLKYFNVKKYKIYTKKLPIMLYKSSLIQIALMFAYYAAYKPFLKKNPYDFVGLKNKQLKWAPLLNKYGVWWLKQGYYAFDNLYHGNYFLNGGFESPKFFEEIRPLLLKELTLKQKLNKRQNKIVDELEKFDSVCISIRKFALQDEEREKIYNVCNIEYFCKAITIMKKELNNPVFYVCSNDVEWVRKNMDFNNSQVIYENSVDKPYIKLILMSKCKHFIISNSTFSWWAQYLGTYEEKKVIAPGHWYNNGFDSPLLQDGKWIYI